VASVKILIVEDESIVALDLENRLKSLGYSVAAVVASGEEALQKATETLPDLVLMDIRLKGHMDGIEAAQEIRARFDVPVVYFTALTDDDTLHQARITEPLGYILKPFEEKELRKTIEMALHKHVMEIKLRESEEALRGAHDELERRVEERTAELARANALLNQEIAERKRAEEELRRYADEQAALYAVTSAVAASLDPDELLSTVLDTVLPVLESDAGWITLPGPTLDDPPRVAAWSGIPESFVAAETALPLRDCPVYAPLLAGGELQPKPMLCVESPRLPFEILDETGLHSHVGIPLTASGQVLGILNVAWRTPPSPSPPQWGGREGGADRALLTAIGQQVGLALHNAQLYQAARQVDRLQVLNELDRALVSTLSLETVMEITLQQTTAAVDAPMGALFTLPQTRGGQADAYPERIFIWGRGWTDVAASEEDVHRLQTFLHRLRESREPIPLPGDEFAVLIGSERPGLAERWGPHGLVIPIYDDGEMVTVLALGGRSAGQPFTDEDRALAQAAAGHASQAIRNARLYAAEQEQSTRLATLNAISAAAVSSLELDTVLRHVLELTCQALDAAEGAILLRDPDTAGLFFALTLAGNDSSGGLHGQRIAPGQGIAGWVAQHGQPVYVNDVRRDPRWYEGVDAITSFETRSLCCAPLRHRGEITGVIEIVNKKTKGEWSAFTGNDLSLLEAVSSIAAAALENARLYTSIRSYADRLVLLHQIGQALTSTLDYSAVVHAALSQVQRLFLADSVSLLQPDPQTGELHFFQALVGRSPVEIPVRLQPGESIAGWALEHGQPVLVEDAQSDPRFSGRVEQHLGSQTRAMMVVPLLTTERAIGVIEVISNEPDAHSREDLNTLQAIASTLTMALENARLYDDLKTLLREREQAQAQLIHSEKVAALGRLTASIAHEINNPLQAVQGCLALVGEELGGGQRREKMDRYLDVAGSEIERIAAIVRRMRDFYRPAREGLQPTDLHSVLESVLELTNKQLQHSDVAVERRFQKGAGPLPMIQANADQLKQVFLNLVLNAIDAMPAGGTLRISTALEYGNEKPGFSEKTRFLRIQFSDTGEGMPAEVLSHLFEPFFTTKEHGSGLGLSISYRIIQSHGGEITVTSQVGVGTTFTILLPVV